MEIRKAKFEDLNAIESIFIIARTFMKENGNPNQWKDDRPSIDTVRKDIENGNFYVVEEDANIIGCFAFIIGEDITYKVITNGAWLNDKKYGTIHRIASDNKTHGIFQKVLSYCLKFTNNIRIDTHSDNKIMQHLLEKNGFKYCGIINTDDGTERMAFQFEK